jgi:hypothetical protein
MGTDRLRLFNKALADKFLTMELESLTGFLEDHIETLREKNSLSTVLFEVEESGTSVAHAVHRLVSEEITLNALRIEVIEDFAFSDEEIYLDYWGCHIVFDGCPEGSISSLDYLPDQEEETFWLLRPDHLDQMIRSLYEHLDDLTIMNRGQIEKLEGWRDYCVANPSYLLAYMFDY